LAQRRYQVAIVGGGPVGVALAIDLGLRGISCVLVERRSTIQQIPKGQNLTQRTLEHFYFWGIVDELRAARVMPKNYPIGGVTAYGDFKSQYWKAPPGREVVRSFYFQDNDRIPQYRLEAVLRAKLQHMSSVETRLGWMVTGFEQGPDSVRLDLKETDGDATDEIVADYVVGSDGGRSMVRNQVDITRRGSDFDQMMVLVVFRSRELHEALTRFPERSTYRVMKPGLDGFWQFFGRVDVGEGWFFHAPMPKGADAATFDFKAMIQNAAGIPFECELDHVGFWDLAVSVADTYQSGRVFIAGDAAHTHPPYGGFGLNNGLEDSVNLGWKLAATLEGWGGPELLPSYSLERSPIFVELGEDFIAAGIRAEKEFLDAYSPDRDRAAFEKAWGEIDADDGVRVRDYEPNFEGSPVVWGPPGGVCGAKGEHSMIARAGHHLAPHSLSSGRDIFEMLGRGFTLLAFDATESDVAALTAGAAALAIPLALVRDDLKDGRDKYAARLILVRPDQHVAWAADQLSADAETILAKVVGRA
jgi:2-polyprenyl-6-methoxyphenol hydroxylase-like FAD-dependent oxidoreductase